MAHFIFVGGDLPAVTFTYSTGGSITGTFNWTGVNLGPARSDRYIVVGCGRENTSCSINGNAMSDLTGGGSLYGLPFPSGTSATITTIQPGPTTGTLFVWQITGLTSFTPTDAKFSVTGSNSTSVSLAVVGDGVRIAIGRAITPSGNVAMSGITRDAVQNVATAPLLNSSGGSSLNASTGTQVVGINITSTTNLFLNAASFR